MACGGANCIINVGGLCIRDSLRRGCCNSRLTSYTTSLGHYFLTGARKINVHKCLASAVLSDSSLCIADLCCGAGKAQR